MTRPALFILAFACASLSTASHAAFDLAASMRSIDGATVATVVLVPPMAVYQTPLDQAGLQSGGCHYTTSDPAAIRRLASIVRAADVTVNPVYQRADMREGVYFALADGRRLSVLFADRAGSKLPATGVMESVEGGQIQSASVSTRSALSGDVREWAKRDGGVGTGSTCDLQSPVAQDPQAPPPVPR